MKTTLSKAQSRAKRHNRLRHKIAGTAARPRLAVFRSNKFVYAQLINDETGTTIAAADSRTVATGTMLEKAKEVGGMIAKKGLDAKITSVVFDRGGFQYAGIVAALADAAREGGLQF